MKSRLLAVGTVLGCAFLSACDSGQGSRIQSTPMGVFYTSWSGQVFQIVNGKLVEIKKATPTDDAARSIPLSQTIPDVDSDGFPAIVSGTLKVSHGIRRLKIDVNLGPDGKRVPTPDQQARFIAGLRDGSGPLKAITISFVDKDGFLASDEQTILIDGPNWTGLTDGSNRSITLEYASRQVSDETSDAEIRTLNLKWSSLPQRKPPAVFQDFALPPASDTPPA